MAQQQRVQEYLHRHKIGPLFEDLMAKLINEMPDDPVVYLSYVLDRKAGRQAMRKSTGDLAYSGSRSPDHGVRKSVPTSHSSWADPTDNLAVAKDRNYDKPWMTNTRRTKRTVGINDPKYGTKGSRPEWDSHNKMAPTTTFDDIWGDTQKGQKPRSRRSPSPSRQTKATWGDSYMDDEDLLFQSYGYRGPHKGRVETDDPLAGEFSLSKSSTSSKKTTSSTTSSGGKKKDYRSSSSRHKKDLERYLKQQQQLKQDSGYEDEKDLEPDDAIELMENLDDLRSEGVKNTNQKGVRVGSSYHRQQPAREAVSVSICARCARVMTGGEPSDPAMGGRYGDLPNYSSYETERDTMHSQPQSARFTALASDDEFESVSQVTGPRKPVWQGDSQDALTPRKGTHMFSSHGVPSKGRPMYSPDPVTSTGDPRARHGATGSRSQDFYGGRSSPPAGNHGNQAYNKTWSPGYYDDGEKGRPQDAAKQTSKDDDDQFGGKGWQVPADYDTDSSYYGGGGGQRTSSKSRKNKTYSGY